MAKQDRADEQREVLRRSARLWRDAAFAACAGWLAFVAPALAQSVITPTQQLVAFDAAAGDFFGGAVAISGPVAAVSAGGKSEVYVYRHDGASFVFEQTLAYPGGGDPSLGGFGDYVAASGDRILVSEAGWANAEGVPKGRVHVYEFAAASWNLSTTIAAPPADGPQRFGDAVALAGGRAMIADPGTLFFYERVPVAWLRVAEFALPDPDESFPAAIGIEGDVAVAGSFSTEYSAGNAGGAYVFRRGIEGWVIEQRLDVSNPEIQGLTDVAISGDSVVLATIPTNLFGSGDEKPIGVVYERASSSWNQTQGLLGLPDDRVGLRAAMDGGLAVLTTTRNNPGMRVRVYVHGASQWEETAFLVDVDVDPSHVSGNFFGGTTSLSNGTALVGDIGRPKESDFQGTAWVFALPDAG